MTRTLVQTIKTSTGATDGVAIAAGLIGEILDSGSIGGAITVSNTAKSIGSLSITAGIWHIICTANYSGSAGNTSFAAYFNTTADSASGNVLGKDYGFGQIISASGVGSNITLVMYLNLSATDTYHLNCNTSIGTAGVGGILGRILAVRIA